ncbi:MAG: 1,4-alpha-glucan branching protein GlgB [Acidimicrobiia bacterium]
MSDMIFGDIDLHLLGEGNHRRLWELLGAHVTEGGARFALWAPNAGRIRVVGDWNDWTDGPDELRPQGSSGYWAGEIDGPVAGQRYKYAVLGSDGVTRLKADPLARQAELPSANASIICPPPAHAWGDQSWMAERDAGSSATRPLRIYEVHLGSWQPGLGYIEAAELLADHVEHLGFTHVELLPIAEYPFGGSWGYQVSGYYAPTSRYGSPDDLRHFVDVLHRRGIGVIVDWVPAHFPKDDWSLARFDGTALYEHEDPRLGEHPDWGTLVFNYGRNEVRNFLVANALYWFEEFHIDGLRVDAVASMLYLDYSRPAGGWIPNRLGGRENLEAIEFLRQLNAVVFGRFPGVLMIAEESTAWPQVTHPVHHGGLGFSHKWNMGWMHDTLEYMSTDPVHRRWHHRDLTFGLLYAFSERFVLPLSHDEVVHGKGSLLGKMSGDEWQRFANLRALYAWMWAYPGAPLLFMGGEMAPWSEWNSDTGLPWYLLDHAPHRGIFDLVGRLNATAAAWPALWERDVEAAGFQWLAADDADESVLSFIRWGGFGRQAVICVANMTPVPRPGYRVGLPWAGAWEIVLDTDAPNFGGSTYRGLEQVSLEGTTDVLWQGQPASAMVDLPPLAVLWLAAAR